MNRKLPDLLKKLKRTGFIHIFGAGTINKIISFASSIILVRILSKSDYGVFAYSNNIIALFLLLNGLGMASGALQLSSEYVKKPEYALKIYNYASKFAFKFNFILAASIAIFSLLIPLPIDGANELLLLLSIYPMLMTIFEFLQLHHRYKKQNQIFSTISLINSFLVMLFSVIGALLMDAAGLIVFRYVAILLSIIFAVRIYKTPLNLFNKTERLDKESTSVLFKISIISMFNMATGKLLHILDVFILGLLIQDESIIASYKIATIIPVALLFIPGTLILYVYPYFAEHIGDKKWVRRRYLQITKYFILFNGLLTVFLIIFAPHIIRLVFGEQYVDATLAFRILMVGYFFSACFRKVIGNLLVTQRKLKFNFWLGITEGVLNIVGNIILISYIGYIGAAVATLLVSVISSAIAIPYFLKVTSSKPN